ncbi:alpha/beta hydrolase [Saltatorellus ferox]
MQNTLEARTSVRIRVHYPANQGKITLRTDADWDQDVQPIGVSDEGRSHTFELFPDSPFVYYKALLHAEGEPRWSAGPNRLATSGAARDHDSFPYFQPSGAQLTPLEELSSEHGTWSIRAFLPPGYDENTCHRYPVLYMQDGHNLFHPEESAVGQEWDVQDTLHQLDIMTSIEQVIVIGVYPSDRMRDYTQAGGGAYRQFLVETLVPHVNATYRTLEGPEHTAILGSSLGAVAALDCAWSHPEHFGMAGCLSGTFGYDDTLATRVLEGPRPELRIYLDSGWPRDNFEVTRDMRARLVRAGFVEGIDLVYHAFPGARHSEADWGDRVHLPLQYFFGHRPEARSHAGAFDDPA